MQGSKCHDHCDLEDRAKAFTPEERRTLWEREARPLVERIFARLVEEQAALRPTLFLAKTQQHALNRRAEVVTIPE